MNGSFFKTRALQVLEFWQKVEFFTPYDLDRLPQNAAFPLTREQLEQPDAHKLLPWQRDDLASADDPYELKCCLVYLGIFDREDIKQACEKWSLRNLSSGLVIEQQHSVQRTCFARLKVDRSGHPDFNAISFSTLPWSLGQLQRNLDEISLDNFQASRKDLVQKLCVSFSGSKLQAADLLRLADMLFQWAEFYPREQPSVFMQPFWQKRGTTVHHEAEYFVRDGILNSPYLQQIHEAKTLVSTDHVPLPLQQYLYPENVERMDLYQPERQAEICSQLQPSLMNKGRWPEEADRVTDLMQQFAINTTFTQLADGGLYSINAPPGTGKATVLKEIVAENLVKRASVLARFEQLEDAFQGMVEVGFQNEPGLWAVPRLNPALTGYEMVIASSNRIMLQTISEKLSRDNLISVVRSISAIEKQNWADRYEGPDFPTAKKAFKEAEALVTEQIAELDEYATYQSELQSEKQFCRAELERLRVTQSILESITTARRACEAQLGHLRYDLARLEREAELLKWKEPGWWKRTAFWLEQNTTHKKLTRRNAEDQGSLRQRVEAEERNLQTNPAYQTDKAQYDVEQAEQQLQVRRSEFRRKGERLRTLQSKWIVRLCPDNLNDLQMYSYQKQAIWQNAALNESRSKLFTAAMQLHHAWLAQVLKQGEMSRSLNAVEKVLDGCRPANSEQTLSTWQWLFTIVPIVPCVFEGFHYQFHGLPPSSLGWLFVHEGGQTLPQQALGALCSTKRVLVMGDPVQLRPSSAPPCVINILAGGDASLVGEYGLAESVQTLADRANSFRTSLRIQRRCSEPMFSAANAIIYGNKLLQGLNETGYGRWFDVHGSQREFVMNKIVTMYVENKKLLPSVYILSPFRTIAEELQKILSDPNAWNARVKAGDTPKRPELDQWVSDRVGLVQNFQGGSEETVFLVLGGDENLAEWSAQAPNTLNAALLCARHQFLVVGDRELWSKQKYFNQLVAHLLTELVT